MEYYLNMAKLIIEILMFKISYDIIIISGVI